MCKHTKKFMSAVFRQLRLLHADASLFSQFVLTYGTMTAILLLLLLIQAGINADAITASKVWSLVVNTYSPTTITFIASLIYEHSSIKNDKKKSATFIFFVIFMALTYMAFEAINAQEKQNSITAILGFVGLLVPVASLCTLFASLKDGNISNYEGAETSDGYISAQKEN